MANYKRSSKKTALLSSTALILGLLNSMAIEAGVPKVPHKADLSHPKGTSPWPRYGETPDTDTPEVKAWVQAVDWSKVPKLPIRKTKSRGDPPDCPEHEVPEDECWWTCSGCFAHDDVMDCPAKDAWGLTFDDGPQPGTTEDLLELLKHKNVTATFFVTGMKSSRAPWLLQETIDQGHHLASHTWSHSGMTTLTNEQVVAELKWTEKYIYDHTGYKIKYFRPPYGDVDNRVRAIARQLGFKTVIWSHEWDTQDWQLEENTITPTQIESIFKNGLKSLSKRETGPISLEHDGDPKMVTVAKTILDMGMAKGLRPMDLAKCLNDPVGYNAVPSKDPKEPAAATTTPNNDSKDKDSKGKGNNSNSSSGGKQTNSKDISAIKGDSTKNQGNNNQPGSSGGKASSASAPFSVISSGLGAACWTLAAVVGSFAF